MRDKSLLKRLPVLPITALVFYLIVVLLWNLNLIPPPIEIVNLLEELYTDYGLIGLAIATFLEGIVYLGLYFPGSFIIALAVFLSDGSFSSLIRISLVVSITLTLTSFINYILGKYILFRKTSIKTKSKKFSKGMLASMIHPNILAFYFFNAGLKKTGLWKIIFVPLIMIPYGFIFAYVLYTFSKILKPALESPVILLLLILIWLVIAFILEHSKNIRIGKIN